MIAETPCPCCGHVISQDEALRWNEHTRTLSGRGMVAQLSPLRGRIFSKLWKAWPQGRMIPLDEMMAHVYADHADGGPDSHNVISVQLNFMRRIIAPFGISIHGRHGYLIYRVEAQVRAPNKKRAA